MTRPRIDMNPVSFEIHGYIVPSNCYRLLRNSGWLELRCQVVEAEPFNGRGPTKPGMCGDDLSSLCDCVIDKVWYYPRLPSSQNSMVYAHCKLSMYQH